MEHWSNQKEYVPITLSVAFDQSLISAKKLVPNVDTNGTLRTRN